jgi:hypothetical protein
MDVYPVSLQFATHINIRISEKPSSMYFLIGPNFKLPLNRGQYLIYGTTKKDMAIDIGIGFDKLFKAVHICPELRYSYGLRNLSENNSTGNMHFHSICLVLNLKGS